MSDATRNSIDRAIERHTWPDGDWRHSCCYCGVPYPECDAAILASAAKTALEQLDFVVAEHRAAIARAASSATGEVDE